MRSTAYKVKIWELVNGKYVRPAEGTEPSYLLTPWGQRISRARVMATVVDKYLSNDQTYAALWLDDGSETIRLKAWREDIKTVADLKIGELVDIIGRVREYEGEVYLVPEMVSRVYDPNWELVRELEILRARRQALMEGKLPQPTQKPRLEVRQLEIEVPPSAPTPELTAEDLGEAEEPLPEVPEEVKKKTLLAFDRLDKGSGVTPIELAAELDMRQDQVEDVLRVLIADGEVYEPKVGKFKRLR
ncbi:MAG: OB-fold nucleic acid binding domain-containing protein [Hadesarchaea archaeon]|nr:OB-fold nucleic acid binding domain-containing protein [Hadesarchaea archaeon]